MKNKKTYIILTVTILFLAGLLVVLEKTRTTNFIKLNSTTDTAQQGPTPEQQKQAADADANAKKQFIENGGDMGASTANPEATSAIEVSAHQEGNGTVTVFTKLKGYSSGKCTLAVSNGDKTTSQEANVAYQPEFSTCAGFSIPTATVGAGTWSIKLTVLSNGATTSNSTSLEVK